MTGPVPAGGEELREVDRCSLPGHDRDVARAIHNQSRLGSSRIDEIQVRHLLAIGYRAGLAQAEEQGRRRAAEELLAAADEVGVPAYWRRRLDARAAALAPENARPE